MKIMEVKNKKLLDEANNRKENISKDISAINHNYKKVLEFMKK